MPHPKPVEKIQLSEGNVKRRLIAAAIVLVIGGVALAYSLTQLLTPDTGWQPIEASSTGGPTCADELIFLYQLGSGGVPVRTESRAIKTLYSDACRKLFQLFHTVESFEGVTNLRDINLHPNETLTVDGILYRAFETVQRHGDRTIYLGPVYARYGDVFFCTDDVQLADFDPRSSEAVRREYEAVAAYARNPQAVELCLLGDNQVCLKVSEEYLAFARQEGIERFLDFGWLKNAFVVDCLGDLMVENGYTHGSISSYDGFTRNLDDRGLDYAQNIYDYVDGAVRPAGVMEYRGPMALAYLRDYPINDLDGQRIYRLKNGERRTSYLSPEDGRCQSAVSGLLCYSDTAGCGEMALELAPIYVAETLDVPALEALAGRGIQSVRCEDGVIRGTDPGLSLSSLYEGDGGAPVG